MPSILIPKLEIIPFADAPISPLSGDSLTSHVFVSDETIAGLISEQPDGTFLFVQLRCGGWDGTS